MPNKHTYYKAEWNLVPEWSEVIAPVSNDNRKFFCKLCKKALNLSNMGRQAVSSHMKTAGHLKQVTITSQNLKLTFCNTSKTTAGDTRPEENVSKSAEREKEKDDETPSQLKAPSSIFTNWQSVYEAEILWVLNMIKSHSSLNSCQDLTTLFQKMFSDSVIAKKMTLSPKKASYMCVFGLGPYFSEQLLDMLKNIKNLVVCFDESLNKVSQKGQMDIVVRYFNEDKHRIESKYVLSVFLSGRPTAENILKHFLDGVKTIGLKKIVQISMDGPNVNWKFYKLLKQELGEDNSLLDIGSCGLHVIHGALQSGHKASGWTVNSFLTGLYWLFKNSPSRRSDFTGLSIYLHPLLVFKT